jgi:polysaccharide biosynthesis transport protein
VKPDRKRLLALTVLLAAAATAAIVVLVETLRGAVRGVGQITAAVGREPLVTVPMIAVAWEVEQRRKRMLQVAGGGLVAGCVVLVLVHLLVVPLDMLVFKAMIRLG